MLLARDKLVLVVAVIARVDAQVAWLRLVFKGWSQPGYNRDAYYKVSLDF